MMILSTCLDLADDVPGPALMSRLHADIESYKAAGADLLLLGTASDGRIVPGRLDALIGAPALAKRADGTALVAVLPALLSLPFHVARALSASDFLTGGTLGWMPTVATERDRVSGFGQDYAVSAKDAPAKALDMIRATQALWDSWDDDALLLDKQGGRYLDTSRVRRVDYRGTHFDVMGPLNAARPPQGYPVLVADEADVIWGNDDISPDILLIGRDTAAALSEAVADVRERGFAGRIIAKVSPDGAAHCCPVADADRIVGVDGYHVVAADPAPTLATFRAAHAAPATAGTLRARLSLPVPVNPFSANRSAAQ